MESRATIENDIEGYLARHEQKELCRFVTVGSVDDGKSTLIGRLLHDTNGIYEDQIAAVKKASVRKDEEIDFSLFTDGLKAEREQGITIDVAYRYFSTDTRKYIIADTPGHVQYTRNMATGASTADVAIILLDARLGVLPQSRRHAYIASLLGIRQLLVAINKMDLVRYEREVFDRLSGEFGAFVGKLGFEGVTFLPLSAKKGDNVVTPSGNFPWFSGPTLLQFLETVPVARDSSKEPFRHPVQYVIRPHLDYRGFAGQIASGVIRPGDSVVVLPSGTRSRIKSIDLHGESLDEGTAPQSLTLRLTDEVDVSRGDMIVKEGELPRTARRFQAMLVWLNERSFDPQRALLLKHTSRMVPARIEQIVHRTNLETLAPEAADNIALNEIVRVTVRVNRPIFCDSYRQNRTTGAFILVDALSNDTVAAGMITEDDLGAGGRAEPTGKVTDVEREQRLGQAGGVVFLADSVRAERTERALFERGLMTLLIEASSLPLSTLGEVAARCARAGLLVLVVGASEDAKVALGRGPLGGVKSLTPEAHDTESLGALGERLARFATLAS